MQLPVATERRILFALGFALVALQRFGVQLESGAIQFSTLISAIAFVYLLSTRHVRVTPAGVIAYSAIVIVTGTSALAGTTLPLGGSSLPAVALVLVTFFPVLGARSFGRGGRPLLKGAIAAIVTGATLAIGQFVVQTASGAFLDPVAMIPETLRLANFNTYYSLEYLGGTASQFKPNGVIFLEPSFLSLFAGIAIIWFVWRILSAEKPKASWLGLGISAAGLAVSASASGVVVVAAGALGLVFVARRRIKYLLVLIFAGSLMLLAGLFDGVITKLQEGVGAGYSSTALRLVRPYELLTPYWLESPFIGRGPGSSSFIVNELGVSALQAATLMKVLVEYGLAGLLVFALAASLALSAGGYPAPMALAIVAAWVVPGDMFLNPVATGLLLVGLANWGKLTAKIAPGGHPFRESSHRSRSALLPGYQQ